MVPHAVFLLPLLIRGARHSAVIDKKAYPSPEPYKSAKSLITGYVSSKMDLIGPAERKVG